MLWLNVPYIKQPGAELILQNYLDYRRKENQPSDE